MTNHKIQTVLFDLDGTLLDTAPDLAYALNQLRKNHGLDKLPFESIKQRVSFGAKALVHFGLDLKANDERYPALIEEFLSLYFTHISLHSKPFDGMQQVWDYLAKQHIPWGIVTNKPARFTHALLKALAIENKAACIISGDTLSKRKPHPDQIVHALNLLKTDAKHCLYIGDTNVDVEASRAAGVKVLVALYGYYTSDQDPYTWKADGYIHQPQDIIKWLSNQNDTSINH